MELVIDRSDADDIEFRVRLEITRADVLGARPFDEGDRLMLEAFGRDDASIEERLMGLQIWARAIEEGGALRHQLQRVAAQRSVSFDVLPLDRLRLAQDDRPR